jgi:hypothetical protein
MASRSLPGGSLLVSALAQFSMSADTLKADGDGGTAVALVRRDEFDAATHSQASALLEYRRLG